MRVLYVFLLSLSVSMVSSNSYGENNQKPYILDETVVTATKQENVLEHVPQPVTVISRQDIENRQPYNIGDMLDYIPGVSVFRSGGTVGASIGVSMRSLNGGPNSVKTLVLVDGRPVNDGWNGGVNWLAMPMEQVERVEVVRGPGSALYGSRSSGGVISIFTRNPMPGFHGWVSLGHELSMSEDISNSKARGYGRPEISANRVGLNGSFGGKWSSHFVSLDYRDAEQSFVTPNKNNWDDYDVLYKGSYDFSKDIVSTLTLDAHHNAWDSKAARTPAEDIDRYYTADFHTRWQSGKGVLSGRVYVNNTANDNTVYISNLKTGTSTTRTGVMADYMLPVGKTATLITGFDGNFNHADVDYAKTVMHMTPLGTDSLYVYNSKTGKYDGIWADTFSGTYGSNSQTYDEHNLAFYAQYTQTLVQKMNIVLGGRFDIHSEFGSIFNPKAGLTYDVYEKEGLKTTLKANFGTAFRAPSMWSLFSKSTSSYGDPDLKPEKTKNYDLGVFQRFGKFGSAELTLYRMDVTNLMINANAGPATDAFYVFVKTDAKVDTIKFNQQKNLGSYKPKGVELGFTVYPHRLLTLKGAYTYLDPGDFTYQTAKNRYNIGAIGYVPLGNNRIEGEILYNFTGDGYFYDFESNAHHSFGLTEARLTYCYTDRYRLSLIMKNLADTKYQYSLSEWQPGRTMMVTIESRF